MEPQCKNQLVLASNWHPHFAADLIALRELKVLFEFLLQRQGAPRML